MNSHTKRMSQSLLSFGLLLHVFLLLLSFQTQLFVFGFNSSLPNNKIMCIESERQSLLSFKNGLIDFYDNMLSSWGISDHHDKDCCNWRGIRCSKYTGHVISLDLHGSFSFAPLSYLMGKVDVSLLVNLSHLNYLNLSQNVFESVIPVDLGNLSKLFVLDLGHSGFSTIGNDIRWLSNLSSLKYLDLSHINFSGENDWLSVISKLPLLESLSLNYCDLPQPVLSSPPSTYNFSLFLSKLELSNNGLNSSIFPWLLNFNKNDQLLHLDLSNNNLQGLTLDVFENMTSLVYLYLDFTNIDFGSLRSLENLCDLNSLFFSNNYIGGLLSNFLKLFPKCRHNSLEHLHLSSNKFSGFLPDFKMFSFLKELSLSDNELNGTIPESFGQLSNLEYLDLSANLLNGTIPESFGQLSNLEYLDLRANLLNGTLPESFGQLSNLKYLSLYKNSLKGEVHESHFLRLTKLQILDLSENSLILDFKSDWVPPFNLEFIFLSNCKLGPLFPSWLQTQNFSALDISFAQISDNIPSWFWDNLSWPNLRSMSLEGNKIKGEIPNLSIKFESPFPIEISLKSNEFVGQIPPFLLQEGFLDLSNNKFSGVMSFLCENSNISNLQVLDLSNNQLSGQLPNCWDHMPYLMLINLANNKFFGELPHSMGNLTNIWSLNLRNNQISGELPSWFNFSRLESLDLKDNNFQGSIPSWIGSQLPNLVHLNLKSNHFHGSLPSTLCNLTSLQVLDIASNNLIGGIPTCITNLIALIQSLEKNSYFILPYPNQDMVMMWKGTEQLISGKPLELVKSIDLSNNHLTGEIPNEITELIDLKSLNLSNNQLRGQIPYKMDKLQSLEVLDLSRNHLSGPIPSSLSQRSMLNTLNVSYNNLSGKIPLGTQLQSFNASSFEGNPYLCGDPLNKCIEDRIVNVSTNHIKDENEDGIIRREFFFGMCFGFVIGFWGIFGSLVFLRKWRHMYFRFFSNMVKKFTWS